MLSLLFDAIRQVISEVDLRVGWLGWLPHVFLPVSPLEFLELLIPFELPLQAHGVLSKFYLAIVDDPLKAGAVRSLSSGCTSLEVEDWLGWIWSDRVQIRIVVYARTVDDWLLFLSKTIPAEIRGLDPLHGAQHLWRLVDVQEPILVRTLILTDNEAYGEEMRIVIATLHLVHFNEPSF